MENVGELRLGQSRLSASQLLIKPSFNGPLISPVMLQHRLLLTTNTRSSTSSPHSTHN